MTSPLTDQQLADIEARHATYKASHNHVGAFACCSAHASADDVPALLAEIQRLRAELAKAQQQGDLWKATADDMAAELDRLRAEVADWRTAHGQRVTEAATAIRHLDRGDIASARSVLLTRSVGGDTRLNHIAPADATQES